MLNSRTSQKIVKWAPQYLICIVVSLIVVIPLVTAVLGGFKTNGELLISPFSLPQTFHWENYGNILTSSTFLGQVFNSTVIMVGTVAIELVTASMIAFILGRLVFRGRDLIFNFFTIGLLFPLTVASLPLYIALRQLNLIDNMLGVILPQVAFGMPISILILRNFFRGVPGELEDAAYIDGCTMNGFFWKILIPLSTPALATVGVLTLVSSWNNFLLPLLVLNKEDLWTLPMGVTQFSGQYGSDWSLIMAFVTLSMVPALAFYLLAERYLVAGLTAGAVKG
jgi:raffinose/stachyose/melibiose transport system permease protein